MDEMNIRQILQEQNGIVCTGINEFEYGLQGDLLNTTATLVSSVDELTDYEIFVDLQHAGRYIFFIYPYSYEFLRFIRPSFAEF
jgi:hypothetical protein